MKSLIGIGIAAAAIALALPHFLENPSQDQGEQLNSVKANGPATAKAFRDTHGHFSFKARMNGKRVNVLVDTGASSVAINRSTAKKIGLRYGNRGTTRVNTANGQTDADNAVVKEIKIGDISVRNVKALVLADSSLNGTLLGMSFLKKLKRFEINGRTLTMVK